MPPDQMPTASRAPWTRSGGWSRAERVPWPGDCRRNVAGTEARGQVPVTFLGRPDLGRSEVILPDGVLDATERQVPGVARHAGRLRPPPRHWQCRPTVGALR